MTPAELRLTRIRLVVLAAVLVTLWSFAAYPASRDVVDLLRVRALADTLGQPIDRLILGLQTERRITAETIAGDGRTATALAGARESTDRAAAEVRAFTEGRDLRLVSAGAVRDRADELARRLDGLAATRSAVDTTGREQATATDGYDEVIDLAFRVYGPEWGAYESELAADTRSVIALARAREMLAREDAVVSAALTGGRLDVEERGELATRVGNQRYARAEAAAGLPDDGRDTYQRLAAGPEFANLVALEDRLLTAGGADAGVTGQQWRAAADAALGALQTVVTSTARSSVERAAPGAAALVARTGAVGLGLVVVLVLLWSWAGTVRRLTEQPAGPDADTPAPPAPEAPTPAARTERELFLRLTQRNQGLLREQLTVLDGLQRRERSAEEADELFRLDHLTTRVRRNVEKLIALSGAVPARRWRRPVPLLDVARGAVAEVPDYQRVLIAPHWPWSLTGPAVPDVIHLLAELIENALAFSPADTTVRVGGEHRPLGCAVLVVDDGPGLDPAALAEANHLFSHPPVEVPDLGPTGWYTVAVLAGRCGAQVSLRPSQRGGVTAVVLLPADLVTVTGTGPDGADTPRPPVRADAPGRSGDDALPTRVRHAGPTGPEHGRTSVDTIEIPIARTARRPR
ncbi:nitrate- and nitrite sensing domain-containing protein [Micromonospora sp. WMMD1120]|uniref:sensor histidine kinase n=1 Tax=Micromonospora sp. WMMD1120 TaxID=3016106 RepID=UPI0024168F2D|nr:nitrate- and nitrite sensing domain-containing protein [Micromonospora sp. WMMD1120]MDG4810689.1 nitrate- and nitrite sensing domain-containing protein [Micromonospora sp. WMMD1120]